MITLDQFLAAVDGAVDIGLLHRYACEAPAIRTAGFVDLEDSKRFLDDFDSDGDESEAGEPTPQQQQQHQQQQQIATAGVPDVSTMRRKSEFSPSPPTAASPHPGQGNHHARARVHNAVSFAVATPSATEAATPQHSPAAPPTIATIDGSSSSTSAPRSPILGLVTGDSSAPPVASRLPLATIPIPDANEGSIIEILPSTQPEFPLDEPFQHASSSSGSSGGSGGGSGGVAAAAAAVSPTIDKLKRSGRGKSIKSAFVWGDFGATAEHHNMLNYVNDSHDDDDAEEEEMLGGFTYRAPKQSSAPRLGDKATAMMSSSFSGSARRLSLSVKSCDELEEATHEDDDDDEGVSENGDFLFGDFVVSRSSDTKSSTDSRQGRPSAGSSSSASSSSSVRSPSLFGTAAQPAEMFMFGDFVIPGAAATSAITSGDNAGGGSSGSAGGSRVVGHVATAATAGNPGTAKSPVIRAKVPSSDSVPGLSPLPPAARGVSLLASIPWPPPPPPTRRGQPVRGVTTEYFRGHPGKIRGLAFASPGEDIFIACGAEEDAPILRAAATRAHVSCNEMLSMFNYHTDAILSIAVTFDYKFAALCSNDNSVSIFEVATSKKVAAHQHPAPVICATFSRNGKFVVTGCQDGACRLWASRKSSKAPIATYFGHKSYVSAILFQPNGEIVASASNDKTVQLWNGATSKTMRMIKGHKNPPGVLDFSANGKLIMSVCKQTLLLTRVADGTTLLKISPQQLLLHYPFDAAIKFTAAALCPQDTHKLHVLVATNARTVSIHEVKNLAVSDTDDSAPVAAASVDAKSAASPTVTPLSPKDNAVLSSAVWDTVLRNQCCIATSGHRAAMLIGDVGGNVIKVTLR